MSVTFATDSAIEGTMDIQRIVEAWQDARDDIDNLTEEVKQLRQDIEMLKGRGPVPEPMPRPKEPQPEDDSDYSYGNWDQDLKSVARRFTQVSQPQTRQVAGLPEKREKGFRFTSKQWVRGWAAEPLFQKEIASIS